MLDRLKDLHELKLKQQSSPDLESRIAQYELAFRMQQSIPEVTNTADEPEHIFKLYGETAKNPGSYAANCLLARRLAAAAFGLFSYITPVGINTEAS